MTRAAEPGDPPRPTAKIRERDAPPDPRLRQVFGLASVSGIAALVLYTGTCSRGVNWQDSGLHQYRILTGMVENPLGLALSHPLHHWLGRLALCVPLGDPAFRINLVSSICGALGIAFLTGLLFWLTSSRLSAVLGGAAVALAHSYWQMSCLTETYTLAAALMAFEWCLLAAYSKAARPVLLIALFAVNGMHVADHMLGALTLAVYIPLAVTALAKREIRWPHLLAAAGAWLAAASPYWALCVAHFAHTRDLAGTLYSTFFGQEYSGDVLNLSPSLRLIRSSASIWGYNFPSLLTPIALVGLIAGGRQLHSRLRIALVAQSALILLFVLRYSIRDQYTFFVPVCMVVGFWFALGAEWLLKRWEANSRIAAPDGETARIGRTDLLMGVLIANAFLPVATYFAFPIMAERQGWLRSAWRDLPYRDEYHYFLRPWKNDDASAEDYARAVLSAAADPGAVGNAATDMHSEAAPNENDRSPHILADLTTAYPIAFVQRTHDGPWRTVRIFALDDCVSDKPSPRLTAQELRYAISRGAPVYAVPSIAVRNFWSAAATFEQPADPQDEAILLRVRARDNR